MTAITFPSSDLFSIITTHDRRRPSPSWRVLFNLPVSGDANVDFAADTLAERNQWAARLDDAVLRAERPVLLVASEESCFATAWWARLSPSSYVSRVAGALLFNPLARRESVDADDKFASPDSPLPFPTAIVGRIAKQHDLESRLAMLADGWGSGTLSVAPHGRSRIGRQNWRKAHALLVHATERLVERRMRVADALGIPAD
ncbi:MAG: alpha/beta hydrolase [Pseudomonadota bacterium]